MKKKKKTDRYSFKKIKECRRTTSLWILLLEPFAIITTWVLVNYSKIKPNTITIIGSSIAFFSAFLLFNNYLILAALFFELYYVFDMVDGRIARLKNQSSNFGKCLDKLLDRMIYFILAFTLIFININDDNFKLILLFGIIFIFLEIFNLYTSLLIKDVFKLEKRKDEHSKKPKTSSKLKTRGTISLLFPTGVEAVHILFFIGVITNKIVYCFIVADIIIVLNLVVTPILFKINKNN